MGNHLQDSLLEHHSVEMREYLSDSRKGVKRERDILRMRHQSQSECSLSLSQVLKEVSQFIQSLICQMMIGHLISLPEQTSFSCSFPSGGLFHISRCSSGDRQESGLPETASHQCLPYMTPSPMSLSLSLSLSALMSQCLCTLLSVFITVDLVLYQCFMT